MGHPGFRWTMIGDGALVSGFGLVGLEDEEDADEDDCGAEEHAEVDLLVGEEEAECDGHQGVDVGVAGDPGGGHVAE